MDDDGGVIIEAVLTANKLGSATDCDRREFVPVSDYVIRFTVEPRVCQRIFGFGFVAESMCKGHFSVSCL